MNKFTPGPWVATKFNPLTGEIDECYLYIEPGVAVIERKIKGRDQHDIANARLISAAPDLLEALEIWLADYDEVAANPDFEPFPHVAERVAKTRAAIAKARGEA